MTVRVYAAGFPCCLIVAPPGAYEEPQTLSYAINSMCPVGPDGGQVHSAAEHIRTESTVGNQPIRRRHAESAVPLQQRDDSDSRDQRVVLERLAEVARTIRLGFGRLAVADTCRHLPRAVDCGTLKSGIGGRDRGWDRSASGQAQGAVASGSSDFRQCIGIREDVGSGS
jgi:hypothetical protein